MVFQRYNKVQTTLFSTVFSRLVRTKKIPVFLYFLEEVAFQIAFIEIASQECRLVISGQLRMQCLKRLDTFSHIRIKIRTGYHKFLIFHYHCRTHLTLSRHLISVHTDWFVFRQYTYAKLPALVINRFSKIIIHITLLRQCIQLVYAA